MEQSPIISRDLLGLGSETFDVLVVGGGASGAATAREAALRGFKTALIEKEDFSAGASAHCFKVVHGGIRYVQHADIRRLRASCFERSVFLRIAPHLVAPLPFVDSCSTACSMSSLSTDGLGCASLSRTPDANPPAPDFRS